jgi:hypothetical protein
LTDFFIILALRQPTGRKDLEKRLAKILMFSKEICTYYFSLLTAEKFTEENKKLIKDILN